MNLDDTDTLLQVTKLLLENGADVEMPDNYGQSPLFMAWYEFPPPQSYPPSQNYNDHVVHKLFRCSCIWNLGF